MKMPLNGRNPHRAAWSLMLLIAIVLTNASSNAGVSGIAAPVMPRSEQAVVYHRAELRKVLSVVEHRTKDEKVLEKMREKLFAMSDRELHLAASLCERIARDDDSARSDIAFSIVAALIVLS